MDKELKSIISSLVPPGNLALCISEFNPITHGRWLRTLLQCLGNEDQDGSRRVVGKGQAALWGALV